MGRSLEYAAKLLGELCGYHGSNASGIPFGIQLYEVSPNNGRIYRVQQSDQLPCGKPPWLQVGNTRGEGGIEHVQIEGNVDRMIDSEFRGCR